MRAGHRFIIYIVILLIMTSGLALLAWRNDVFESLYVSSGLEQVELLGQTLAANTVAKDTLDLALLENAKFLVLKDNVNQFDFNLICQDASNRPKQTNATSSFGVPVVAGQAVSCALGNGAPFPAASSLNQQ